MKKVALAVSLFFLAPNFTAHAQSRIAGTWQAELQPNDFVTMELRVDGDRISGAIGVGTTLLAIDGAVSGATVSFKATTLDGDRTLTFTGTVSGDEIAFTREVQVRPGGNAGGAGIFGAGGPRTLTVTRVPEGQAPKKARGLPFPRQLTEYDRQGKVLRTLGAPDDYNQPVLSPDGTRLAAVLRGDIWVFDFSRGTQTRITATPSTESAPVWSPNGRQIAYASFRQRGGLYRRASDGTGNEELLYQHTPGAGVALTDWSPDGRLLSFGSGGVLFTLPIDGDRKAIELAREEFTLQGARFSPDSRFLAYRSDESGEFAIYVRAFDAASGFPPAGVKGQVSKGGLGMVHWRQDGRELLYLGADGGVMAVDVSTTPTFNVGTPSRLFRVPDTFPLGGSPGALGSISRDGQRVVLAVPIPAPRKEIRVASEILARYAGTYELFGMEATITLEGSQLVFTGFGERAPAFAQSETSFFFKDGGAEEVDFVTDENGLVTHFLFFQGGPPATGKRK